MNPYKPIPTDTSMVDLPDYIEELTEKLAENVHENWALQRIRQGWNYGPVRDDEKKETPCLVPYDQLPEEEKLYDRSTALETIKLIWKLGYRIIPKEESSCT